MFDKLKQIGELKKMQEKMKEEKIEVIENKTKVILNGIFEVEEIVLDQELSSEEQVRVLKKCFNQAVKDIQIRVARSFSHLI